MGKAVPLGLTLLTLGMAEEEEQSQANKVSRCRSSGTQPWRIEEGHPSSPSSAFCLPVLICDLFLSSYQEKDHITLFMKATLLNYFPLLSSHSLTVNLDP